MRLLPTTELRRLRWKLAGAYTITTASVLASFLLLLSATLLIEYGNPRQQERAVQTMLEGLALHVAPLLAGEPVDRERLSVLMTLALERSGLGYVLLESPDDATAVGEFLDLRSDAYLVALDRRGAIVASTRIDAEQELGRPVSVLGVPGLEPGMVDRLAARSPLATPGSKTLIVVPIQGSTRLGALVYIGAVPSLPADVIWDQVRAFAVAAAVGTIGAAAVGLVFGLWVAGGLTRRLSTIETVSAAWGRGDFAPRLADRSSDEIGQLSRQLNGVAEQLQQLVQEQQQFAALEERNRLARDLHDSVKQHVFAVTMNLAAAEALWHDDPAAAAALATNATATAGTAQRELTAIIHALRPVELERGGLAQALRDLVVHWTSRQAIVVTPKLESNLSLAPEHGEALFRIAQEALANAVRHSGATHVTLELRREGNATLLRIADNGRGFAEATAGRGLGLQSMRERVAGVGATLTISSSGTGTIVEVILRTTTGQENPQTAKTHRHDQHTTDTKEVR